MSLELFDKILAVVNDEICVADEIRIADEIRYADEIRSVFAPAVRQISLRSDFIFRKEDLFRR